MRLLLLLTAVVSCIGVSQSRLNNNWKSHNMVWFPASDPKDCMGPVAENRLKTQTPVGLKKIKREVCTGKEAGERFCFCTGFVNSPSPPKYGCGTCELQLLYDWKSVAQNVGDMQQNQRRHFRYGNHGQQAADLHYSGIYGQQVRSFNNGKRGQNLRDFRQVNQRQSVPNVKVQQDLPNPKPEQINLTNASLNKNFWSSPTRVNKVRSGQHGQNWQNRLSRPHRLNRPGKSGRHAGRYGYVAGSDNDGESINVKASKDVHKSIKVSERRRNREMKRAKKRLNKANKILNKTNLNEVSKNVEPTEAQRLKLEAIHDAKMKDRAAARAAKVKANAHAVKAKAAIHEHKDVETAAKAAVKELKMKAETAAHTSKATAQAVKAKPAVKDRKKKAKTAAKAAAVKESKMKVKADYKAAEAKVRPTDSAKAQVANSNTVKTAKVKAVKESRRKNSFKNANFKKFD